ncbi:hypothetical protein [Caballeronia sp. HLA56]
MAQEDLSLAINNSRSRSGQHPYRAAAVLPTAIRFLAVVLLSGCSSPFVEHYEPFGDFSPQSQAGSRIGTAEIIETSDLQKQISELKREGYVLSGASCFIDVDTGRRGDQVKELAQKTDADIVVSWQIPMNAAFANIPPSVKPRKDWEVANPTSVPVPMKAYCAFPMFRLSESAPP